MKTLPLSYRIMIYNPRVPNIGSIAKIAIAIKSQTGMDFDLLRSRKREEEICDIRNIFCYLARKYNPQITYEKIGMMLNRRHASIMHCENSAKKLYKTSKGFKIYMDAIENSFLKNY